MSSISRNLKLMRREDLRKNVIVTGLCFQEPVKILTLIEKNSGLSLLVSGMVSGLGSIVDITENQIAQLSAPAELNPPRQHRPLIQSGRLTIPLYHGTSSLFVRSILENGLGGRNIIKEVRAVELLGILVRVCEEELDPNEEWAMIMCSANKIANQIVTSGGYNYRHGTTYLTPAKSTAARYAAGKEYGSEVIEYFMMLYQRIMNERPALISNMQNAIAPLLNWTKGSRLPILVEVNNIPIEILKTEAGDDPAEQIQELEELLNDEGDEGLQDAQQDNFEAIQPISPQNLTIYQVGSNYRYGDENVPLIPYCG